MKKLALVLFSVFILFSCELVDGTDGVDGVDGGLLYDANDVLLGKITSANEWAVTVLTSNDYLVLIEWYGIHEECIKYTEVDGGGDAFVTEEALYYYKTVYYGNNQLYTYNTLTDGVPTADETITSYESFWDTYQDTPVLNNSGDTINDYEKAYLLKTITADEVGIPDTITLPLRMEY